MLGRVVICRSVFFLKKNDIMTARNIFLAFGFITLSLFFLSCDKETKIITQTEYITVIDTVTIIDTIVVKEMISDTTTTFILVRHAETAGGGSNPNLSNAGKDRAAELSRIMENVPLTAIFSTNYNRTKQTANPVADSKNLPIEKYAPARLESLADQILSEHKNEVVLVCGHSNTTPQLVNLLIGSDSFPDLPESEYGHIFIVSVLEKGRSSVLQMKYGN